ncbi:PREDICTED: capZ-interacting protein, partial [Ceratotherium simum simum]|uniref:CapZ-interacting protein n=1 Tax=Ceratotherium simum simum TaxID=73337 RepID=A0ABM1CGR6_CERSS
LQNNVIASVKAERPAETNANVDDSAPPSVAQLAGRFREQAAAAKEIPASKPTRRKPPCSLPLFPTKVELGQNGEEKSPPNASHPPKIKVKSSPLIEKLQANLAFDPAALLPGASPKSPGLKTVVSPFHSPPSTPSSPGVRSRPSEPEEVPVSFDQPPEGSHLPSYNKVRTRGSIKRRPPSRRFRRSQSDCGDLGDFRAAEPSQENGAKEENGDEVFSPKSAASGSPGWPLPTEGAAGKEARRSLGSQEKPPLRRKSSGTEKQEEEGGAPEEAQQHEKAVQNSEEEAGQRPAGEGASEPPHASGVEAENGCGSPTEDRPAGEQTEESTEEKEERAGSEEDEPGQKSQDVKGPRQGAVEEESPQSPPGGVEGGHTPEQGKGKEKQEEGAVPEPGCSPGTGGAQPETSGEVPRTEDDSPVQDTRV